MNIALSCLRTEVIQKPQHYEKQQAARSIYFSEHKVLQKHLKYTVVAFQKTLKNSYENNCVEYLNLTDYIFLKKNNDDDLSLMMVIIINCLMKRLTAKTGSVIFSFGVLTGVIHHQKLSTQPEHVLSLCET